MNNKSLDELIAEARKECELERLSNKRKRYGDDEVEELIRLMRDLDDIEER